MKRLTTKFTGKSLNPFPNSIIISTVNFIPVLAFYSFLKPHFTSPFLLQQTPLNPPHLGATELSILRRIVKLYGEAQSPTGLLSAPGAIDEPPSPTTRTAAATTAAVRSRLPPGAKTPTRPRGPRDPKPIRSQVTGDRFTLAPAPRNHKHHRDDTDDDEEAAPAPKRLKWNIHDDYALEHEGRDTSTGGEESPEIINLVTPSTDASSSSPEIINLVTPSTEGGSPWIESSIATASTYDRP